jgi:putative peptidoglycan lipid II flippase
VVASALPTTRSLRRTMGGLVPINLAVQVCSFVSSVALARVLGASASTDAYYLGLSIPVLTYGIFMGALRAGAIPSLAEVAGAAGEEGLGRASGELVSSVLVATAVLTLVVTGIAEALLPLIAGGDLLALTRVTLAELAPYAVIGATTGVLGAVLAVRGVFALPVVVMMFEPIIKTVLTFSLGHEIGVQALIMGNLVGSGLALAVLWRAVQRGGISLRVSRHFNTPFVRTAARISLPLIASFSVLPVNPVVDRTMASGFGPGSITALELGLRLFSVPAGLFTGLLIAPIIATWSARKAAGGWPALRASATRALNGAAAVLPPFVVLGVVLRHQLVALVFQGGAYPSGALHKTTAVFGMILLSLPAQMLIVVFSTLFIVQKDTVFPMKLAFANVGLNVALNFAFRALFGVAGIALSTSITYTLLLVAYAFTARRRWGSFYAGEIWPIVIRVVASVALVASVAALLIGTFPAANSRPDALVVVVVVGLVGLVLHLGVLVVGRDHLALGALSRLRTLAVRASR